MAVRPSLVLNVVHKRYLWDFSVRLRNYFCLFFNQKIQTGNHKHLSSDNGGEIMQSEISASVISQSFSNLACAVRVPLGTLSETFKINVSCFEFRCEIVQSKLHNLQINIGSCIKLDCETFDFCFCCQLLKRIRFQSTFSRPRRSIKSSFSNAVC